MLTTPALADILASAERGTSPIHCDMFPGSRDVPRAALTPPVSLPSVHIVPTVMPVGCAAAGDAAAISAAAVTPASASDRRTPDVEIFNVHPLIACGARVPGAEWRVKSSSTRRRASP